MTEGEKEEICKKNRKQRRRAFSDPGENSKSTRQWKGILRAVEMEGGKGKRKKHWTGNPVGNSASQKKEKQSERGNVAGAKKKIGHKISVNAQGNGGLPTSGKSAQLGIRSS